MPRALSAQQTAVLAEISRYVEAAGEPCRASHIARRLKISRETVRTHVAALVEKGWLRSKRSPYRPRNTV